MPAAEVGLFDDRTPAKLKGKEWENEVLKSCEIEPHICGGRYGVKASGTPDNMRMVKSLPDLEGCVCSGVQWIAEAKVITTSASYSITSRIKHDGSYKQLSHLLERSEYGAITMFLLHFNQRELSKSTVSPCSFAVPVHPRHPLWQSILLMEQLSITRADCTFHGVPIEWGLLTARSSRHRPRMTTALQAVNGILELYRDPRARRDAWRDAPIWKTKKKVKRGKSTD